MAIPEKFEVTEGVNQDKPHDPEYYFIQLCFCHNRDLLRKDNHKVYKLLFERYEQLYYKAVSKGINDIQLINDEFTKDFGNKALGVGNEK